MSTKKRLEWLDIARALGIVAVIAVHSGFLPNPNFTSSFLSSWMLPIFALAGGWVFTKKQGFAQFLLQKIKRLLVPYFVFIFLSFFSWLALKDIYPGGLFQKPIKDALNYQYLLGWAPDFNSPLWFLPTYFLGLVIAYFLLGIGKNNFWGKLLIISAITFSAFVLLGTGRRYIFYFDLALLLASFILLGNWVSKLGEKISLSLKVTILLSMLFVLGVAINGPIDMFAHQFQNPVLYYLNALNGSLLVIQLSQLILSKLTRVQKLLAFVGKYSLIFFAIHAPIIYWIQYLLFTTGTSNQIPGIPFGKEVGSSLDHIMSLIMRGVILLIYYVAVFLVGKGIIARNYSDKSLSLPARQPNALFSSLPKKKK